MLSDKESLQDSAKEVKSFPSDRDSYETESTIIGYGPPQFTTVENEGLQRIRITGSQKIPLNRFRKGGRLRTQLYLDAEIIEPGPDKGKYTYVSYNMNQNGTPLGPRSRYWRDWSMVNGRPPSGRRVTMDPRKFHRKEFMAWVVNKTRIDTGEMYCVVAELRLIDED